MRFVRVVWHLLKLMVGARVPVEGYTDDRTPSRTARAQRAWFGDVEFVKCIGEAASVNIGGAHFEGVGAIVTHDSTWLIDEDGRLSERTRLVWLYLREAQITYGENHTETLPAGCYGLGSDTIQWFRPLGYSDENITYEFVAPARVDGQRYLTV